MHKNSTLKNKGGEKTPKMKITPELIAALVGGHVEGDPQCEITGFAKIEEAKKGDISFISNPKYIHYAPITSASVLLVAEDLVLPESTVATLIRVKDPYSAIATLLAQFNKKEQKTGIEQPTFIAENVEMGENVYVGAFSYISSGVKIGDNVKIYPHAYIGEDVEIGDDTEIRPHVTIYEGCRIGKRCVLHAGCVIGADGFGFAPDGERYKKIPQIGIAVIEDDVEIGANTTVDRATMGVTRIGEGTKLDNLIMVAHNVSIGKNNVFAAQTGVAGSTKIGDSNRVGGQVGFAGHIQFGNNCEVGAQSGINKGFGDYKRIIGYPATEVGVFARSSVILKKLPELLKDIENLKREIKKDNK